MARRRPGPVAFVVFAVALCASRGVRAQDDLVAQARRLDLAGKQAAAVALYRQALERTPDSFDAHYGIARALDLAGDYDDARAHFTRAVALAPDSQKEQAIRMLGIAWTFVGNAEEASRAFQQVYDRRLAAGSFESAAEEADEIGRVWLEFGDPDKAETWYRTGHEVASREVNRPAWQADLADIRWAHAQARIAARRGRAVEARQQEALVKKLLAKGGNKDQQLQYPYLLGYVNLHLKHYEAAAVDLRGADQTDPFVLLLEARTAEKLGQMAAALGFYHQILQSTSHAVNAAFARPVARMALDARAPLAPRTRPKRAAAPASPR